MGGGLNKIIERFRYVVTPPRTAKLVRSRRRRRVGTNNRQIPLSRERPRERLSLYGAVGGGGWVKI